MKRQTLNAPGLRTLDWFEDKPMDWNSAGTQYNWDGSTQKLQKYHFGFVCDGSISSENGEYALIYQKRGTKGLLLKKGEVLREINRSYYQSDVYEFPATFLNYQDRTYLIHCPNQYCQLDIEDVETGETLTNIPERNPHDVFHSRLEVSPDNQFILNKGWYCPPFDGVELFNVAKCMEDPLLLDGQISSPLDVEEVHSANFINEQNILLCVSIDDTEDPHSNEQKPYKYLAVWNIHNNELKNKVPIDVPCGNIFSIDETKCWDLYEYPKIIDTQTGEVIAQEKEIFSGKQASSIIRHLEELPQIAFNRNTKQIAIANKSQIEILTP